MSHVLPLTAEEVESILLRVPSLDAFSIGTVNESGCIEIAVDHAIRDGSEIKFRSPVNCSEVSRLLVTYIDENGADASKKFAFADANGNDVGEVNNLFAAGSIVKVILDLNATLDIDGVDGAAFVQNADTNAYLENALSKLENDFNSVENNFVKNTMSPEYAGKALVIDENGNIVPGAAAVQPDWNQNDSTASDYIKNKPFSEVVTGGDTLTWDGNTEGLVTALEGMLYRISDKVITSADCKNGMTIGIVWDGEESRAQYDYDLLSENEAFVGFLQTEEAFFIPSDNFVFELAGEAVFPKAGIYVMEGVASITIPGYNGFEQTIVTPMDEKYIPDTIVRTNDLDGKLSKVLTSDCYGEELPVGGAEGQVFFKQASIGDDMLTTFMKAMYPVNSVYTYGANVNPSEVLGFGEWELVGKGFIDLVTSPTLGSANCPYFTASANVESGTLYLARSHDAIRMKLSCVTSVVLSDATVSFGSFNWNSLGISDGLYYSITQQVAGADGANAAIIHTLNSSTGDVSTIDIIPKTDNATVAAGTGINFNWTLNIDKDHMLDSACDKFYWKRIA